MVVRIGSAGVRGVRDSRKFRCEACNHTFYADGDTMWETMGRLS